MAHPVIDLIGASGQRIGEAAEGALDAVVRSLEPGDWTLQCPFDGLAIQDGYSLADINGIRVVDGSAVIFAGTTRPLPGVDVGGIDVAGIGDSAIITLSGQDVGWSALASRRVFPDPATEAPWASGYDVRTGVASSVAVGFIDANMGPSAIAARRWPGLALLDGTVGLSSTWSGRLQRLDRLVARICADSGIICRPSVDASGALTITLAARHDLSARIVLSDQGDLSEFGQRIAPTTASHVIAGGQGDLAARAFAVASYASTGSSRVEHFIDQRELSVADELTGAANTALRAAAATRAVRASYADGTAPALTYLADYDVGDVISIESDLVRYSVVVDSVRITLNPDKYAVRPQLGEIANNAWTALVRSVASLESSTDNVIA